MSDDVNVIWRRGDDEMPDAVQKVVTEARGDLLLRTLEFPNEVVDLIKYNAEKNAQTVKDYIAHIVAEKLERVS
jgi:hypothetical protein